MLALKLKGILGDECRLVCTDGGLNLGSKRSRQQDHLPERIAIGSCKQFFGRPLIHLAQRGYVKVRLPFAQLTENIARANHGVLIRPGLPLEAEGVLEIESDDRRACELEEKIVAGLR